MDHRPASVARRLAAALIASAALMALAAPAGAQGTLRGVLHDSLRTDRPIAGAEVVLLGADRRATTDARGRFEFRDVPTATVTVAYWAPWLDSLGLPPLQAAVRIAAGAAEARLATPSLSTYQVAVCGTVLGRDEGVLLGELRRPDGVPLAGVAVGARWQETLVGAGQLDRRLRAALDTADASGLWSLCGVPTDAEFGLVAGDDTLATSEIVIGLRGAPVLRRDLVAAPAGLTTRVTGRLVGPDSLPLAGVTVFAAGDTAPRVRTDAEGRFRLERVPRRTSQLVARAIGLVPALHPIDPAGDEVDLGDVVLARMPRELATVTVTGEPMTANQLQFETRRARGLGQFAGDEELRRIPVVSANAISGLLQGVTAVGSGRNRRLALNRRSFGGGATSQVCFPRWFEDGFEFRSPDVQDEESMLQRAKRIEVYTAPEAPPRYNDFDGCGVVLVWTR